MCYLADQGLGVLPNSPTVSWVQNHLIQASCPFPCMETVTEQRQQADELDWKAVAHKDCALVSLLEGMTVVQPVSLGQHADQREAAHKRKQNGTKHI